MKTMKKRPAVKGKKTRCRKPARFVIRPQSLHKALFESSGVAIAVGDAKGRWISMNRRAVEMLGYTPEELRGRKGIEVTHPDDRAATKSVMQSLAKGIKDSVMLQKRFLHKSGRVVWVDSYITLIRTAKGKPAAFLGMSVDITERKEAERRLQLMQYSVDRASDAVFWVSPEGKFLYVNDAASLHLGYSREELLGMGVADINPEYDYAAYAKHWKELRQKGSMTFETRHRLKDGRIVPVEVTANFTSFGGKEYNFVFVRDITERVVSRDSLQASLREKEIFLKELNHRVKNNLQVVSSIFNLQARRESDPRVQQLLHESTLRVKAIALAHEKLYQSRDLEYIGMQGYLGSICESLRAAGMNRGPGSQIAVRTDIDPGLSLDMEKTIACGLIVNELVTNALQHGFPEGRPGEVAVILAQGPGGGYVLEVRDNGRGLPEGFDPRASHTLGLQLVQALSSQLGTLEFGVGPGTAVRIVFQGNS